MHYTGLGGGLCWLTLLKRSSRGPGSVVLVFGKPLSGSRCTRSPLADVFQTQIAVL